MYKLLLSACVLFSTFAFGQIPFPSKGIFDVSRYVVVHKGKFKMGSPISEPGRFDDEKIHEVTISRDFKIGAFHVTQIDWYEVVGNNPSFFKERANCPEDGQVVNGVQLCPNNPVDSVSWNDVKNFLAKLNNSALGMAVRFRLPTEAEWEFATRGGTQTRYFFGDDDRKLDRYAWFNFNSENRTHPVGKKLPNNFGLYDVHGNVWDWVEDAYDDYPTNSVIDPLVTDGLGRVIRGGSYFSPAEGGCRAASRGFFPAEQSFYNVGFRLIMENDKLN